MKNEETGMISDNYKRWEILYKDEEWNDDRWERFLDSYETFFLRHIFDGADVLELGYGTWESSALNFIKYKSTVKPGKLIGVDFSKETTERSITKEEEHSGEQKPIQFHCSDILDEHLIKSIGTFDYIILFRILEHFSNPETVLCEYTNLLKPKGKILVSVPNSESPVTIEVGLKQGWGHVSLFTIDSVQSFVSELESNLLGLCADKDMLVFLLENK